MNQHQNFDQLLQSAVIASWVDLIRGSQRGLIHVEYGFSLSGGLDHLQIWSCMT
jgi:hypothetical protein